MSRWTGRASGFSPGSESRCYAEGESGLVPWFNPRPQLENVLSDSIPGRPRPGMDSFDSMLCAFVA